MRGLTPPLDGCYLTKGISALVRALIIISGCENPFIQALKTLNLEPSNIEQLIPLKHFQANTKGNQTKAAENGDGHHDLLPSRSFNEDGAGRIGENREGK